MERTNGTFACTTMTGGSCALASRGSIGWLLRHAATQAAWDGTERFEVLLKRAKTDNGVDGVANGAGAGAGAAAFFGARSAVRMCPARVRARVCIFASSLFSVLLFFFFLPLSSCNSFPPSFRQHLSFSSAPPSSHPLPRVSSRRVCCFPSRGGR